VVEGCASPRLASFSAQPSDRVSARSARQRKAWGASPRIETQHGSEPAERTKAAEEPLVHFDVVDEPIFLLQPA
jgi:hypothetical protein